MERKLGWDADRAQEEWDEIKRTMPKNRMDFKGPCICFLILLPSTRQKAMRARRWGVVAAANKERVGRGMNPRPTQEQTDSRRVVGRPTQEQTHKHKTDKRAQKQENVVPFLIAPIGQYIPLDTPIALTYLICLYGSVVSGFGCKWFGCKDPLEVSWKFRATKLCCDNVSWHETCTKLPRNMRDSMI